MNVIINGILGRMGRAISNRIIQDGKHSLLGGVDPNFSSTVFPFTVVKNLAELIEPETVVIDFSLPEGTSHVLAIWDEIKFPMIIGTTGLSSDEIDRIRECSKEVPVVHANNFSIGVTLLQDFVRYMTSKMKDLDYDIEIIEGHHRFKKDAPSGTARTLLDTIQAQFDHRREEIYGRKGVSDSRDNQIGIHSIRGGGIIGKHEVHYIGKAESLSISHEAFSREVFVDGVILALDRIGQLKPGYYTMSDLLDL
ncbi:MAG: 4-hydroxy-tetrahydrodipicolinate reductase [Calditrichia bacterium]